MSGAIKKSNNKRTITVEDIENGAIRIIVAGTPYMVSTGADSTHNLSTHDIAEVWLSDFAPDKFEDRVTYSAEHCTDTGSLHGPSTGCDGSCHDLNCSEPADFFQHWKGTDGKERCIPRCKRHSRSMAHYVGRAVLWALNYGVVEDLRFWTQEDPLPVGLPRCDCRYYAVDSWGDSERARCTNEATTKVRVTELWPEGKVYDVKLCSACADHESKRADAVDRELGYHEYKVEIL